MFGSIKNLIKNSRSKNSSPVESPSSSSSPQDSTIQHQQRDNNNNNNTRSSSPQDFANPTSNNSSNHDHEHSKQDTDQKQMNAFGSSKLNSDKAYHINDVADNLASICLDNATLKKNTTPLSPFSSNDNAVNPYTFDDTNTNMYTANNTNASAEAEAAQQQQQQQQQQQHNQQQQQQQKHFRQRSNAHQYQTLIDNHYNVHEKLGEGAFSIVARGHNTRSGEDVAIKIISKAKLDKTQQQSVLKEVTILRRLNHENIVAFENFFEDREYYYIVQELCTGGEIFNQIVNLTYFSEDLSRHVICQIAEAVRYLHNGGIVHRDLKPENLLFDPVEFTPSKDFKSKLRKSDDPNTKKDEGEFQHGIGGGNIGAVKLADFGLSKQIWESKTKTPCGTVGYTAPEIVKDERYSNKVDMWALGCVLYTLLCGFPPFYDEKIDELTEKISRGHFEFLRPWWDEISIGAKNCVLNLLCVNSKQRYDINQFFEDPWIKNFLAKVPKDSKGNYIYSGYDPELAALEQKQQQEQQKQQAQQQKRLAAQVQAAQQKRNATTATAAQVAPDIVPVAGDVGGIAGAIPVVATPGGTIKTKQKKHRYNPSVYSSAMNSPAAIVLKDAFDVSTAVHRHNEEKLLRNQAEAAVASSANAANNRNFQILEEEEEDDDLSNASAAAAAAAAAAGRGGLNPLAASGGNNYVPVSATNGVPVGAIPVSAVNPVPVNVNNNVNVNGNVGNFFDLDLNNSSIMKRRRNDVQA